MSTPYDSAISEIKQKIAAKEAEITPLRITVNELCKLAGLPEEYSGIEQGGVTSPEARKGSLAWKPDHFFGRPLATCVVEYFEARKKAGLDGPASIDDVFDALCEGGFKFEGTTGSEANTKRAIKISLTKNTAQFVKVRDDLFGLKKWYGMRAQRKTSSRSDETAAVGGPVTDTPETASTNEEESPEPISE